MEKIEITKEEYRRLKEDSEMLNFLYLAGVDNWEGYDYALELRSQDKNGG